MRRFLAKLCLLSAPLLALVAADLTLPRNTFTFRAWEALAVYPILDLSVHPHLRRLPVLRRVLPPTTLPGPFVPNADLDMIEVGDLGHHTPYAHPRPVVWETDAYGYRARRDSKSPIELVIVGDSVAVGSGLTQKETLSEVMGAEYGVSAYAYAPETVPDFLADPRFREHPPRFVVVECIERNVLDTFSSIPAPRMPMHVVTNQAAQRLELALLSLESLKSLQYLRARLDGPHEVRVFRDMLFLNGPEGIAKPSHEDLSTAADTLARYDALAKERGLRLAVLIIPDKETTYADLLPGAPEPTLLPLLHAALRERNVTVVDVSSAFRIAREEGKTPYWDDDTHWNATGVRIAASALAEWVTREEGREPVRP